MNHTDAHAALTDLLPTPGLDLDEAADRHFAPDYRQRTDGSRANRTEFLAHIAHLRTVVAGTATVIAAQPCEVLRGVFDAAHWKPGIVRIFSHGAALGTCRGVRLLERIRPP
jgi:hypothetical protein